MSQSGQPSPVEQSVSDVGGKARPPVSTKDKVMFLIMAVVIALGFIWFRYIQDGHTPAPTKTAATASGGGEHFTAPPSVQPASATESGLPLPTAANTSTDPGASGKPTPQTAPILAYSGGSSAAGKATGLNVPSLFASPPTDTSAPTEQAHPASPISALAQKLQPTVLSGAMASVIKNPDMVVTEGTLIPCILQTAIDTQLAGFVTCVIPVDVRGTSGNVVLLDRGTKIVGQIQAGLVQGQERVFVLWTRAETPKHVVISLNAPGADELGRSGLPGAVDNHWWQRFGGALMLTLVQGSLNAGTALAANSGDGSNEAALGFVYGAQSSGQQVANTALQNTINIPPTLRKNQGDTVGVLVAQDLDFSKVYGLKVSANAGQ